MKENTPPGIELNLGKELAYIIVLPKALDAISQKQRRRNKSNASILYEKLLGLKNSLDDLFITTSKKNTEEYQYQLYKKIITEKLILNIASGKTSEIKQNIEQIMKEENLRFIEREESQISAEEKFLIKTDFQGLSHYPSQEQFSPVFQRYIKTHNENENENKHTLSPHNYNLEEIPAWKYFKQFPSFVERSQIFKLALAEFNIHKQDIKNLNSYDLIALLKNYSIKHKLPPFENSKMKFIKFFIKHHEQELRNYYQVNKLVIIQAYRNKGLNFNFDENPNAYQDFVERSISQMKEFGYVPPLFNIHHKYPVKDCKSEKNLSLANAPSNVCLILQSPYHQMMHLFDTNILGKTIFNRKVKRLELPQELIFFGGFDKNFQIYHKPKEEYRETILTFIKQKKQRN